MLSKLFFIAAISISLPAMAEDDVASMKQARLLIDQKSYAASVQILQKVFAQKEYGRAEYYDAACAAALAGQAELALVWLNKSIDKGWRNLEHLRTDTDLESLHTLPAWQLVLEKLQAKLDVLEKNYDQALKKELEAIHIADQKMRRRLDDIENIYGAESKELQTAWKEIHKTDAMNLKRVTQILDSKG